MCSSDLVMDRCNLTVLETPGQEDTPEFLAGHQVEIVASLPCYLEDNVNTQRGKGVFDASIRALRKLNALGVALEAEAVFKLANCAAPGRPHVGRALVQAGLCATLDESFDRFLKNNICISINYCS